MTLFLKRRKVLDYELFEQQAINNNKTYEFISFMQEIKLQDCESKSFSFPQKNNAFALFLQKYLVTIIFRNNRLRLKVYNLFLDGNPLCNPV